MQNVKMEVTELVNIHHEMTVSYTNKCKEMVKGFLFCCCLFKLHQQAHSLHCVLVGTDREVFKTIVYVPFLMTFSVHFTL